jgi:hypothetical protein
MQYISYKLSNVGWITVSVSCLWYENNKIKKKEENGVGFVVSSLGFIQGVQAGLLEPNTVCGTPLDIEVVWNLQGTIMIMGCSS